MAVELEPLDGYSTPETATETDADVDGCSTALQASLLHKTCTYLLVHIHVHIPAPSYYSQAQAPSFQH